jgi:hypothetical protein
MHNTAVTAIYKEAPSYYRMKSWTFFQNIHQCRLVRIALQFISKNFFLYSELNILGKIFGMIR